MTYYPLVYKNQYIQCDLNLVSSDKKLASEVNSRVPVIA